MQKIIRFFMVVGWVAVCVPFANGADSKMYTDPSGYEIKLPQDWVVKTAAENKAELFVTPPHETAFQLTLRTLPQKDTALSLNDFVDQVCVPQIQKTAHTEILEKWRAVIDGKEARTVLYIVNHTSAGKMRYKASILAESGHYYWFTYGGKDPIFEQYSALADEAVSSFKLKMAKHAKKP